MGNVNLPETLSAVADRLRAEQERFRTVTHEHFFSTVLEARTIFPLSRDRTHLQLVPALADVLERTPLTGEVPPHMLRHVAGHGHRHRRHAFPPEAYEPFAEALSRALADVATGIHPATVAAAERALRQVCAEMAEAARQQDLAGVPPAHLATVTHVERRSRRISVVHLETGTPVDYLAGQTIPVTASYLPGVWRMLSPALPPNDYGQLEFHVQAIDNGIASPLLSAPRVGDHWTLGAPVGALTVTDGQPLLLIAHRSGFAPLRAIVFDLLQRGGPVPPVHLVIAAEYPGELHDLTSLHNVSRAVSWLSITVVAENPTDPWWVGATETSELPDDLTLHTTDDVGTLVLELGDWSDREVLVAGPARGVHEIVWRLFRGGVPAHHVNYEAWLELS